MHKYYLFSLSNETCLKCVSTDKRNLYELSKVISHHIMQKDQSKLIIVPQIVSKLNFLYIIQVS